MKVLFQIAVDESTGEIVHHVPISSVQYVEENRDRIVGILADVTMLCDEGVWPVKRGVECYHIIPVGDLIEHVTDSVDCSCGIKGDWAKNVIIHSALDGRKPYEKSGDSALWLVVKGKM